MDFPWRRKQTESELPSESRIDEIVEGAQHASVTKTALIETRRGRRLRSDTGWLHQHPLISYFESEEQPHFILESTQPIEEEIEDDETKKWEPTPPYRSFACVTEHRILLLTGREPENWVMSIPFEDLLDFGLKPGKEDPKKAEEVGVTTTFTPILQIQIDSARYTFANETSLELRDVLSLGSLIKSNFEQDRWEYEAFWESAQRVRSEKQREVTERKRRRLEREAERRRKEEERERKERLRKEAAERERREQIQALARDSSSTSVTPARIEAVFDYLYEGEIVEFILWGGGRGSFVFSPDGEVEIFEITDQDWTAITSERLLFATIGGVGQLSLKNIETARIGRFPEQPVTDEAIRTSDKRPALILTGGEFTYVFEASEFALPHLQDLVEAVRGHIDSNSP